MQVLPTQAPFTPEQGTKWKRDRETKMRRLCSELYFVDQYFNFTRYLQVEVHSRSQGTVAPRWHWTLWHGLLVSPVKGQLLNLPCPNMDYGHP